MSEPRREPPEQGWASLWQLDPAVTFLNHGSFGACPSAVLEQQSALRARLEAEPVRFFVRELEGLLDAARSALSEFVGSDPEDLVFVPNATAGVNAVLRSLQFEPGDELLVCDHEYGASRNALDYAAARSGARVVVVNVPFPIAQPEAVTQAFVAAVGPRTRLALVDHVTSQTGLVFPVADIVSELAARGVDTLVDGAHAPGMLTLDLKQLGAAYYTGNCHKWICAPKGAALLRVRRDRQAQVRPLAISHGAGVVRAGRSRYLTEFDWVGTVDPTAYLCVPAALEYMGSLLAGGWAELRRRNRALALGARDRLAQALGVLPPAPESMIGSLAVLPLPDAQGAPPPPNPFHTDSLQDELFERFGIEVPVIGWPRHPRRLLRISAQLYNDDEQYDRLADALGKLLPARA